MNIYLRWPISILQIVGAVFMALKVFTEVQSQPVTPVVFVLSMLVLVICAISVAGGILLFYNKRTGYILSSICQTLQVVAITTSTFSFAFTFGFGIWIMINTMNEINNYTATMTYFELHRLYIKEYVDTSYQFGVNLVAAFIAPKLLLAIPAKQD